MPQIFISHATANDLQANALRNHLIDHHFASGDIFVDHGFDGIRADDKWQDALAAANASSVALICLVSPEWLESKWGQIEVKVTQQRQKFDRFRKVAIIIALIGGVTRKDMRARGFNEEQIIDLKEEAALTLIKDVSVGSTTRDEAFSTMALTKLRRSLEEVGVRADSYPWVPRDPKRPTPYPGLEAFTETEAGVFFGREASIAQALGDLDALRSRDPSRVVTVLAASGVGKSSFLRAGLWPRLKRRDGYAPLAILRSGRGGIVSDPATGLIERTTRWFSDNGQSVDPGTVRGWLGSPVTRDGLIRLMEAARKITPANTMFVIGIDQAEELFDTTDERPRREASEFLAAVFDLLSNPVPHVDLIIVSTIRLDSANRLGAALQTARDAAQRSGAPNAAALSQTLIELPPLSETAYRDVITEPIAVAHQQMAQTGKILPRAFEPALVEHLLSEFKGADALPLLAMTLDQLFREHAAQQTITRAHYHALYDQTGGPVGHALAEAYRLAKEAGTADNLKRLLIPQLATWDPAAGAAKRIVADEATVLADGTAALKTLADAMVTTRLLTRGETTIEVAHEALLRQPPVSTWIEEDKDALRQRDDVLREAQEWAVAVTGASAVDGVAWQDTTTRATELRAGRSRRSANDASSEYLVRRGDRLLTAIELAESPAYGPALLPGRSYLVACLKADKDLDESRRRLIGRAFVKPAVEANARGEHEHALRLAAAGAILAEDLDMKLVPELWQPAAQAIMAKRADHVLHGHKGGVGVAAFSPDGKRVVTGADDNTARLWDASTGAAIAVLKDHTGAINAASFSPDGKRVVTGSDDNTARLWDAATGAVIAVLKDHTGAINAASFSPVGNLLVTGSDDKTARLWDAATGAAIAVLKDHTGAINAASFSPDGNLLVTGSNDKTARLWNASTGAEIAVLMAHTYAINAASFSPDGTRVVTGSIDSTARLWDASTGAEITVLNANSGFVYAASFSPNGRRVVTGSVDNARLWDASTGVEIGVLEAYSVAISAASFSPDGTRVVMGSHDNTARLWDAESGAEIAVLKAHDGFVRAASFSPDGKRVVTGSDDNTARLWDVSTGVEIAVLNAHTSDVFAASLSPDGTRVVTGSGDQTVRLWDASTGAEIAVLNAHTDIVLSASFSPDGKRVVTGSSDRTARLWDAESSAEIAVLKAHDGPVCAVSFSPDGKRVVTGSDDNTARVWDAATSAEMAILKHHTGPIIAASFSPDGKYVVTGSGDNTARLWDASTGAEIAALNAHSGFIPAASFSPDGKRVVTGSSDNTARLWDVDTSAEIAVLNAHTRVVRAASFSPDGKRVVTGSDDTTVRLWDANTGAMIAVLKAHNRSVRAASFSPDGRRVVTGSSDNTAKILDVERSELVGLATSTIVTAALGRGIGNRTAPEAADLLMQDAPEDLYAAALRQIGRDADAPELQRIIAGLHAPKHPNQYLSPSAFAAKFGLDAPSNASVPADYRPANEPSDPETTAVTRAAVSTSDTAPLLALPPLPLPARKKRPKLKDQHQRSKINAHLPEDGATSIRAVVDDIDPRLAAYEDANADAVKAQASYKRWGGVALTLMTFATIVSALMLFPLERLWPQSDATARIVSGLQSLANAIALAVVWWLNNTGAIRTWMETRATAEQLRGDYFRALLAAPAPAGVDAATLTLWRKKFDLFEAAHVDYQRKYFTDAEAKHRRSASSRAWPRALATTFTLAGIAIGALAFFGPKLPSLPDVLAWIITEMRGANAVRWQLGFNTAASALLAYASARAMVTQDERNAALYAATGRRLDELRTPERLAAVRAAADAGDGEAVLAYAREAQAILDADHQAWMLNRPPADPTAGPPEKFKV